MSDTSTKGLLAMTTKHSFPDRLTLRDTKVNADEGQRIYSTATGYGYKWCEYVRADIASPPSPAGAVAEPVGFLNAQGGFLLTDSGASWLKDAIADTARADLLGQPVVAVFANPEPAMSTELVERLRAGPIRTGDSEDGEYELFDIEGAAEAMYEAADELTALTAKVALLTSALRQARIWHESEDKSLSKQPPSYGPEGNQWARLQHQEQIAEIEAALNPKL